MYRFTGANGIWWWDAAQIQNADSSWENLWSVSVRIYDSQNFGTPVTLCVSPGWIVYYNTSANDRGSSHKYNGSAC